MPLRSSGLNANIWPLRRALRLVTGPLVRRSRGAPKKLLDLPDTSSSSGNALKPEGETWGLKPNGVGLSSITLGSERWELVELRGDEVDEESDEIEFRRLSCRWVVTMMGMSSFKEGGGPTRETTELDMMESRLSLDCLPLVRASVDENENFRGFEGD